MPSDIPRAHLPARFRQATEMLELILGNGPPAELQVEHYFRRHREMGSRDRAFAADTVYGCLRRRRTLAEIAGVAAAPGATASAAPLVAAYLVTAADWSADDLDAAGFRGEAAAIAARARSLDAGSLPFDARADLPEILAEAWRRELGDDEALALAAALHAPAPVDLRANALRAPRARVIERLAEEGIEAQATPWSPDGIRLDRRRPVGGLGSARDGWFEVQDEGSQLIAYVAGPRPGERIADLCAGAGGKTLHLASLMENRGQILAYDVDSERLERMRPRLKRAGVTIARAQAIDADGAGARGMLATHTGKLHCVLVDAPCSGSGTLRRHPDLAWQPIDVARLAATGLGILETAATLVRRGGRLVYATCSLLRAENEDVVEHFLEKNPAFARRSAAAALATRGITPPDAATAAGDLLLYPHRTGTDGFYAALMERVDL